MNSKIEKKTQKIIILKCWNI